MLPPLTFHVCYTSKSGADAHNEKIHATSRFGAHKSYKFTTATAATAFNRTNIIIEINSTSKDFHTLFAKVNSLECWPTQVRIEESEHRGEQSAIEKCLK